MLGLGVPLQVPEADEPLAAALDRAAPPLPWVAWVVEAATQWLGKRPVMRRMETVKFKNPLLPDERFVLELTRPPTRRARYFTFSLASREKLYSSGRLVLR